jgi:hypothetical protein
MKRTSKRQLNLSDSLHRRLNSYALAASAAGVGALALAMPAEAKIVYTHAHLRVGARSNTGFNLDLNHDGTNDFTFAHGYFFSTTTGFWGSIVHMLPYKADGNGIMGNGNASALQAGAKIGPGNRFSHYGSMASARGTGRSSHTQFYDAWANGGKGLSNRYVGLRFLIKGKVHYGWARVSVSKFRFGALLTGYAYETVANKPIIAGKTKGPDVITVQGADLGHLAAGAAAIPAWRAKAEK